MDQPTTLAQLRDILADLYQDEESARRVVDDAGLDTRRVAFSSQALDNWHAILQAAVRHGRIEALCEVVRKEYANHAELHTACEQFRAAYTGRRFPIGVSTVERSSWLLLLAGIPLLIGAVWIVARFMSVAPTLQSTTPSPQALLVAAPSVTPTSDVASPSAVVTATTTPLCPSERLCILVASFTPVEKEDAIQFTERVVQDIRTLLDDTDTQRFTVQSVPPVADPEQARRLAREEGALLIVWGQVLTVLVQEPLVTVHFQVTDLLGVGESESTQPYRVQPLFYDEIEGHCPDCLYLEAAQRTKIVAYAVAGLIHYVQHRPRDARMEFMTALFCAGAIDEKKEPEFIPILQPKCKRPDPPLRWNPGLIYYYAGKSFYLEGNYRKAKEYLEEAAARNPADPAVWIGIGSVLQGWLAKPNAQEARDAWHVAEEKAAKLLGEVKSATRPVVYFDRGFARELAGDPTGAQEDYQAAAAGFIATGDSPYVAWIALARAQRQADHPDAAQATLMQAIDIAPELPWAYLELARLEQDAPETSKAWLDKATEHARDEASIDVIRARLCRQWHDYDCAEKAYAEALKKRPEWGLLYLEVGQFYLPREDALPHENQARAEEFYTTAAENLRPDDPTAHQLLAYALNKRNALPEAIQHYQQVIELVYSEAEEAIYYCDIGDLQQRSDLRLEAKISFQRCADLTLNDELRKQAEQWQAEITD